MKSLSSQKILCATVDNTCCMPNIRVTWIFSRNEYSKKNGGCKMRENWKKKKMQHQRKKNLISWKICLISLKKKFERKKRKNYVWIIYYLSSTKKSARAYLFSIFLRELIISSLSWRIIIIIIKKILMCILCSLKMRKKNCAFFFFWNVLLSGTYFYLKSTADLS